MLEDMLKQAKAERAHREAMDRFVRSILDEIISKPDCPEEVKRSFYIIHTADEATKRLHEIARRFTNPEDCQDDKSKRVLEYMASVLGGLDAFIEQEGLNHDES